MVAWYVDKGLERLIEQVKAKHPGMSVGTIGDAAHQKEKSDHNPEADGSVDAADFMLGAHFSSGDATALANELAVHRDNRIAYVIWNRRIISSTVSPWVWRPYSGSDPHTGHVHVSVNDKHENDTREWDLGGNVYHYVPLVGYGVPELHYGANDQQTDGWNSVHRAQKLLNYVTDAKLSEDGIYGPATANAVKKLVGGNGRTIDAAVWVRLFGLNKVPA